MTVRQDDVLTSTRVGEKVIRGGAVRGAAYGGGMLLGAIGSVFLLRHLGVVAFGEYVTVMALIGIVAGVTDAGLTVVATRELAVRDPNDRDRLTRSIVGIRFAVTPVAVLLAVAFAAAAGYDETLVAGTAFAGAGLILTNAHASMILPLGVELRNVRLAVAEFLRQAISVIGIVALAIAGAALLPFFVVQIVVGALLIALTPLLLGRSLPWPRFDRDDWRLLLRETLPLAAAFVIGILYFRILVLMTSLLSTEQETGYFATSFRILELLAGIPLLLAGVVLPVVSAVAREDRRRLQYVLRRMTEVGLIAGIAIALLVAVAAEPVIVALGGDEYRGAAPMLRIQAFALVGIFVAQAATAGLVALRRQAAITLATAIGLLVVTSLGFVLIPTFGGEGAAAAALAADAVLAGLTLAFLARAGAGGALRPRFVAKVAAVGAVAAAIAVLPGVPAVVRALAAVTAFLAGLWFLDAIPSEIIDALRLRRLDIALRGTPPAGGRE